MPEKRKTDFESRDDSTNFTAKRVRQQVCYDDLEDAVPLNESVKVEATKKILEDDVANSFIPEAEGQNVHLESNSARNKQNGHQRHNQQPRVDPIYGQRSAFPGLDDAGPDELLYGPPEDGLEYLRLVRSEANSLPSLFVASTSNQKLDEGLGSSEVLEGSEVRSTTQQEVKAEQVESEAGYVLIDGVVIGTSSAKEDDISIVNEKPRDAQLSYYNLLQHRFVLLRTTLRCAPPATAIADLDANHPITLPFHAKAAREAWRQLLFTSEPQMVQLACMDMETILGVLRLLGTVMIKCVKDGDPDQLRRIGAWAWGLLGRCRDVGELGSEEVGELRVFGRKALNILKKLNRKRGNGAQRTPSRELDLNIKDFSDEGTERTDKMIGLHNTMVTPAAEGSNDETLIQTVEIAVPDDKAIDEHLEAAKSRLQSKLFSSNEYEGEEFEAEEVERWRRNTSSPLGESEDEDEEEEDDDDDDDNDDDVAYKKSTTQSSQDMVTGEDQARILLDMIITIVGGFYGQKDLLQQRNIWD